MINLLYTFTLIIIGGFLPAFIWLWLILKEDREHPEPRHRLVISFFAGMGAVVVALIVETFIHDSPNIFGIIAITPLIQIILFAATEELAKYFLCNVSSLHSKAVDEPIDMFIYMAVTALGFAALENSLFLAKPFIDGNFTQAFLIAHVRFVGSTLVHLACSGIVGLYLAETYYKRSRFEALILGLVFATALHSLYNFFIMSGSTTSTLGVFIGLWIVCVALVLVLNHAKKHFK